MIDIIKQYSDFCEELKIPFQMEESILSYDDSTLFCPAGMQKYKSLFKNDNIRRKTIANVQPCLRLNDLDNLGDGEHLAYFNMIGLFSFRDKDIEWGIDFCWKFIERLGIISIVNKVTVHPQKNDWKKYHEKFLSKNIKVNFSTDENCKWSDGEIGGYCTEFYINNIEILNIVNPLENCLDMGAGLERIDQIVNNKNPKNKLEILEETIVKIIDSGIIPSNVKHGYVLRRLLRLFYKHGGQINHPFFIQEKERQIKLLNKYNKLKNKYKDKTEEWWFDTHGIDLKNVE
mgnify:CR=1 FL=1